MTYEAALFVKSWAWRDMKPVTNLGVKVYTDVFRLLDGRYCLSLEHLIAQKDLPQYRKGNGLVALKQLCHMADSAHVPITLVCRHELVWYYSQVGFAVGGDCDENHVALLREVGACQPLD